MSYALLTKDIDQLCSAMTTDDINDVQVLIEAGADVNSTNSNKESALHMATCLDKVEIVLELLQAGGDTDLQNKNGQTALHLGAAKGYDDIVALLIDADADINMKTFYTEMTALHLASQNGHTEVVNILLENGADTSICDAIYEPAMFYAANEEITKLLKHHDNKLATERLEEIEKTRQKRRDLIWSRPPPPYKSSVSHKQRFSQKHRQRMQMNVFDRLTRKKSLAK